jgi:hypothetical protein
LSYVYFQINVLQKGENNFHPHPGHLLTTPPCFACHPSKGGELREREIKKRGLSSHKGRMVRKKRLSASLGGSRGVFYLFSSHREEYPKGHLSLRGWRVMEVVVFE